MVEVIPYIQQKSFIFSYISLQTMIEYSASVRRKRSLDKIRAQEGMENQLLNLGKCIIDRDAKFIGVDVYRITSIKGEDNGYQFYAPDEKTLLARFGWEAAEREAAKGGGLRGFVKKAAEAAKAALKGKRVLQLHSEQLRPLLALSSVVQLMEIEREDERRGKEKVENTKVVETEVI
jgi:hypothetical protein